MRPEVIETVGKDLGVETYAENNRIIEILVIPLYVSFLVFKTSNGMELPFNKKKRWLRRVNGLRKVNKTLKLLGYYLIFLDESPSFNAKIKE